MKGFEIYENAMGQYKAVKVGFSWPGFFFGGLWALFAKLWKVAGFIFGGLFALGMCLSGLSAESLDVVSNVINLGVAAFIGFQGNSWISSSLIAHGYELKGNVVAANKDAAIASYMRS